MPTINEITPTLLHTPISESDDTRPAELTTFIPAEQPNLVQELNEYSKTILDDHRLTDNYTNIDFANFQIVSVWKRNNIITGFASGWDRKGFYPPNTIRILNRFYHDKENSRVKFTREVLRPSTFACVLQQLLLAQRLGYDCAFISREIRSSRFFRLFVNAISDKTDYKFNIFEGPVLVAPDRYNPSCWQSLAYTLLTDNITRLQFINHWSLYNGR